MPDLGAGAGLLGAIRGGVPGAFDRLLVRAPPQAACVLCLLFAGVSLGHGLPFVIEFYRRELSSRSWTEDIAKAAIESDRAEPIAPAGRRYWRPSTGPCREAAPAAAA